MSRPLSDRLFTTSWFCLVLAVAGIPLVMILLPFIEGWGKLGVIAWGAIYMAIMSFLSVALGILPARKRRVAMIWVIPQWLILSASLIGFMYDGVHRSYLSLMYDPNYQGNWSEVIIPSLLALLIVLSVILIPVILSFPEKQKKLTYKITAGIAIVMLLIALPDLLF